MRLVGYGSMALESFVAVMALIAATLLDPGVFFAINSGAGVVGATPEAAVHTISGWGFPVTVEQMACAGRGHGREDSVCPHRRRAVSGGRHGQHPRQQLRPRAQRCGTTSR